MKKTADTAAHTTDPQTAVKIPADSHTADRKGQDLIYELLDWLKYILIAVLIGLFMVVFVAQRNAVVGQSMLPALHHNDQLLVEKVSRWFDGIDYGDIVTIKTVNLENHDGTANIIKRVIAMPGDTVEITDDGVLVNDKLIEEHYLAEDTETRVRQQRYAKLVLDDDEYYLLGDNRDISLDSRTFGPVHKRDIIGKVLIRFYPFDQFGQPE